MIPIPRIFHSDNHGDLHDVMPWLALLGRGNWTTAYKSGPLGDPKRLELNWGIASGKLTYIDPESIA